MPTPRPFNWFCIIAFAALAACQAPATPVPTPTPIPTAAPSPTAAPANQTSFHSPADASFSLPLSFTHGPEWDVAVGIRAIEPIYKGYPPGPDSQWWGPGITLVSGALVHNPADVVSNQPTAADKTKFVPWPDDFFAYVTLLPGVKVIQGPEPVTIGGVQGRQVIVHTPAMHPILWLKDDYTWSGGGASGVDPEAKQQLILLDVKGERVLLVFSDAPDTFDAHYPLVQALYSTITFAK